MNQWLEYLNDVTRNLTDHIIVTLVNARGSAPQEIGAKMLVTSSKLVYGTVGGGKIEAHCLKVAAEMLENKANPQIHTYNLQKDIGMTCGGEVTLFFDTQFFSRWSVAIFGGGHVSQELCRVMQTWSCQIRVFETRKEWLDKLPASPNIHPTLTENMAQHVESLPQGTYLMSLTQGHSADVPVLEAALKQHERFVFLGVIGSAMKGEKIKSELRQRGVSEQAIERLHCPIGLEIGDNTPPEIAISIAAQLLTYKSKRTGK
ncbi:MAG: xanthine dehydrogenase accessory protein XdhC [Bdellovibrionaceae bacterium]|nr:xanthine dehydrogenase accessory protein XdhC [Pseudobdellovibrionaceae bacterium]